MPLLARKHSRSTSYSLTWSKYKFDNNVTGNERYRFRALKTATHWILNLTRYMSHPSSCGWRASGSGEKRKVRDLVTWSARSLFQFKFSRSSNICRMNEFWVFHILSRSFCLYDNTSSVSTQILWLKAPNKTANPVIRSIFKVWQVLGVRSRHDKGVVYLFIIFRIRKTVKSLWSFSSES